MIITSNVPRAIVAASKLTSNPTELAQLEFNAAIASFNIQNSSIWLLSDPIYSDSELQLVDKENIEYFFLVKLSNKILAATAPYDVQMSDGNIYKSENSITLIDPPRLSTSVDRATYKMVFSDNNFEMRSFFEDGAVGSLIEVRMAFYNPFNKIINNIEPTFPFTNIEDTILIYKGVVDSASYSIDVEGGQILAYIEGGSPMSDLDLVNTLFTNKDSLRGKYPNDSSFDKSFEGSGEISLKWGKV
jgi:hypothetical protein